MWKYSVLIYVISFLHFEILVLLVTIFSGITAFFSPVSRLSVRVENRAGANPARPPPAFSIVPSYWSRARDMMDKFRSQTEKKSQWYIFRLLN